LGQVYSLTDRDVDNIINGICKAIGRPTSRNATLEYAWGFGRVFAFLEIWKHQPDAPVAGLAEFLDITTCGLGVIGGGKKRSTRRIDIAVMPSLSRKKIPS
jgi:hypothetical protein